MKLNGAGDIGTLVAADNYALSLLDLEHFKDAKSLMRKVLPVARRVLGEGNDLMIRMSRTYAMAIYRDAGATLDGLREAVTTLKDLERTARRVLGGEHPLTKSFGKSLRNSRAALAARETPPPSGNA